MTKKINSWVRDVEQLAKLAIDEPQLAYSAHTKALSMRWCFLQRTVLNIKHYFAPLEESIREQLIPAILGRKVTDLERKIISLPVRLGGLGIQNPVLTADREFRNSSTVTMNLTKLIEEQQQDLRNYNKETVESDIARIKREKEKYLMEQLEEIKNSANEKLKRSLELANEKGAGLWLTALPLQAAGYVLNKQEFRDGICLRYGWSIPNTPFYCACGVKSSVDHTLICKLGGYVNMRHNNVRDLEANLLKEVCKDVKVEPELLPIGDTETSSSNDAEKARLDVSAVGIWSSTERTFLDVRVMHPNSPSYLNATPDHLYSQHEREKKRTYNDRILQVEKGSFTPLVFSTTGGMGSEATKYHKRVARLISEKRGEEYSDVVNYIRTRIRFSLLRSTLVAVRGDRGRRRRNMESSISDLSLNLLPERSAYEV